MLYLNGITLPIYWKQAYMSNWSSLSNTDLYIIQMHMEYNTEDQKKRELVAFNQAHCKVIYYHDLYLHDFLILYGALCLKVII